MTYNGNVFCVAAMFTRTGKMYPVWVDCRGFYIHIGKKYVQFSTGAYNHLYPQNDYSFCSATYAEIDKHNESIDEDIMLKEACDGRCPI